MQEFDGGGNFSDYLSSGILTTPIEKSTLFFKPFQPMIIQDNIPIGILSGVTGYAPCWRVTGFFSSPTDRTGDGTRMINLTRPSNQFCVFFSGYDGMQPVYLTYLNGRVAAYP